MTDFVIFVDLSTFHRQFEFGGQKCSVRTINLIENRAQADKALLYSGI